MERRPGEPKLIPISFRVRYARRFTDRPSETAQDSAAEAAARPRRQREESKLKICESPP